VASRHCSCTHCRSCSSPSSRNTARALATRSTTPSVCPSSSKHRSAFCHTLLTGDVFSFLLVTVVEYGAPAVLEQKTTICYKYLYLLASLKDSPGLGGTYKDKPQRCGRKPCSWVKYHGKRGQNQGFSSPECVGEDLRFSPQFRQLATDRCFLFACYGNPILPKARGLRHQFLSWCTRLSRTPTTMPLLTSQVGIGLSYGSHLPTSTVLRILPGISRVPTVRLKRDDLGGVF